MRERTDEVLKQLAQDILDGKVFTPASLRDGERDAYTMRMIFLPLMLAEGETLERIREAGMIYEYMDKAGPRSINGYPVFFSMKTLSKEDMNVMIGFMEELERSR